MPSLIASLADRMTPTASLTSPTILRLLPFAIFYLAALVVMVLIENGPVRMLVYLLTWGMLNFLWLALLRRPTVAAGLSLAMFAAVIWISRFKHGVLWMTANFTDVMIIDAETIAFLWTLLPEVRIIGLTVAVLAIPLLVLLWRIDPWRVRRRVAAAAAALCFSAMVTTAYTFPLYDGEVFADDNNISIFMRSGVEAVHVIATRGYMESDASATERLKLTGQDACQPVGQRPHIILLHDELSFDIRAVNGVKVPDGYGGHFRSFDGKQRDVRRRGCRRAELVHRIQRARRPVGTQLRQIRRISSPRLPLAGSSAVCRGRCAGAATAPSRSIPRTAPSWARRISRPRLACRISSTWPRCARATSSRTGSTTTSRSR